MAKRGRGPAASIESAQKQEVDKLHDRLRNIERNQTISTHLHEPEPLVWSDEEYDLIPPPELNERGDPVRQSLEDALEGEHLVDSYDDQHTWFAGGKWWKGSHYPRARLWATYGMDSFTLYGSGEFDPPDHIFTKTFPFNQGFTSSPKELVCTYGSMPFGLTWIPCIRVFVPGVYAVSFAISIDDFSVDNGNKDWGAWQLHGPPADGWWPYWGNQPLNGNRLMGSVVSTIQYVPENIFVDAINPGVSSWNPDQGDWFFGEDPGYAHPEFYQGSFLEVIQLGTTVATDLDDSETGYPDKYALTDPRPGFGESLAMGRAVTQEMPGVDPNFEYGRDRRDRRRREQNE